MNNTTSIYTKTISYIKNINFISACNTLFTEALYLSAIVVGATFMAVGVGKHKESFLEFMIFSTVGLLFIIAASEYKVSKARLEGMEKALKYFMGHKTTVHVMHTGEKERSSVACIEKVIKEEPSNDTI
jgi:hypothetical protein